MVYTKGDWNIKAFPAGNICIGKGSAPAMGFREMCSSIRQKGIRLSVLNHVLTGAAVLILALILLFTFRTDQRFTRMQEATALYITCQKDAMLFQEGSDYLTNECRSFVATGAKEHVFNFVEEVEVTRRREKTREDADSFRMEADSLHYLDEALRCSNELMEVECYAMRLVIDALDMDVSEFPDRIRSISLSAEDLALTAEEKRDAATDRLFNEDYLAAKSRIYEAVEKSIDVLLRDTQLHMEETTGEFNRLLRLQQFLIIAVLLITLLLILITRSLMIRPLENNIRLLDRSEPMEPRGAREIRHLADVYNQMLDEHQERHEELSYTATHDALTDVYNRAAFESARKSFDPHTIGVLIVDIYKFKHFNDTYGHDMGDRVLQRVAQVLRQSFRSEDHISRIGGDEFCVIMVRAGSQLTQLVIDKVDRMNRILGTPEEGMPPIALSVGVAFGDRENPGGDIFKDADTALYRVKNGETGTGCMIY